MGAAVVDQVGYARLSSIEGELLVHDGDRYCPAGLEVLGDVNRMPEGAQVASGQGARPRVLEIGVVSLGVQPGRFLGGDGQRVSSSEIVRSGS